MAWTCLHATGLACNYVHFTGRGDVRLAQGGIAGDGNAQFGRLEIFDQGGWGTVCDNPDDAGVRAFRGIRDAGLTQDSVDVACKQIGFEGGELIPKAVRASYHACMGCGCHLLKRSHTLLGPSTKSRG